MLSFESILHKRCSISTLLEIAQLKKEFWHYTIDEHLHWMDLNIGENDIHILLRNEKSELIAYLNIVEFTCQFGNTLRDCMGVMFVLDMTVKVSLSVI